MTNNYMFDNSQYSACLHVVPCQNNNNKPEKIRMANFPQCYIFNAIVNAFTNNDVNSYILADHYIDKQLVADITKSIFKDHNYLCQWLLSKEEVTDAQIESYARNGVYRLIQCLKDVCLYNSHEDYETSESNLKAHELLSGKFNKYTHIKHVQFALIVCAAFMYGEDVALDMFTIQTFSSTLKHEKMISNLNYTPLFAIEKGVSSVQECLDVMECTNSLLPHINQTLKTEIGMPSGTFKSESDKEMSFNMSLIHNNPIVFYMYMNDSNINIKEYDTVTLPPNKKNNLTTKYVLTGATVESSDKVAHYIHVHIYDDDRIKYILFNTKYNTATETKEFPDEFQCSMLIYTRVDHITVIKKEKYDNPLDVQISFMSEINTKKRKTMSAPGDEDETKELQKEELEELKQKFTEFSDHCFKSNIHDLMEDITSFDIHYLYRYIRHASMFDIKSIPHHELGIFNIGRCIEEPLMDVFKFSKFIQNVWIKHVTKMEKVYKETDSEGKLKLYSINASKRMHDESISSSATIWSMYSNADHGINLENISPHFQYDYPFIHRLLLIVASADVTSMADQCYIYHTCRRDWKIGLSKNCEAIRFHSQDLNVLLAVVKKYYKRHQMLYMLYGGTLKKGITKLGIYTNSESSHLPEFIVKKELCKNVAMKSLIYNILCITTQLCYEFIPLAQGNRNNVADKMTEIIQTSLSSYFYTIEKIARLKPGEGIDLYHMYLIMGINLSLHESFNVSDQTIDYLLLTTGDKDIKELRRIHNNKNKQTENIILYILDVFAVQPSRDIQVRCRQNYIFLVDNLFKYASLTLARDSYFLMCIEKIHGFMTFEQFKNTGDRELGTITARNNKIDESMEALQACISYITQSPKKFTSELKNLLHTFFVTQSNYVLTSFSESAFVFMATEYKLDPDNKFRHITEYTRMMILMSFLSVLYSTRGGDKLIQRVLDDTVYEIMNIRMNNSDLSVYQLTKPDISYINKINKTNSNEDNTSVSLHANLSKIRIYQNNVTWNKIAPLLVPIHSLGLVPSKLQPELSKRVNRSQFTFTYIFTVVQSLVNFTMSKSVDNTDAIKAMCFLVQMIDFETLLSIGITSISDIELKLMFAVKIAIIRSALKMNIRKILFHPIEKNIDTIKHDMLIMNFLDRNLKRYRLDYTEAIICQSKQNKAQFYVVKPKH